MIAPECPKAHVGPELTAKVNAAKGEEQAKVRFRWSNRTRAGCGWLVGWSGGWLAVIFVSEHKEEDTAAMP